MYGDLLQSHFAHVGFRWCSKETHTFPAAQNLDQGNIAWSRSNGIVMSSPDPIFVRKVTRQSFRSEGDVKKNTKFPRELNIPGLKTKVLIGEICRWILPTNSVIQQPGSDFFTPKEWPGHKKMSFLINTVKLSSFLEKVKGQHYLSFWLASLLNPTKL